MTKRKTYTAAFKANVVLELLREEKPLAQMEADSGEATAGESDGQYLRGAPVANSEV